MTNRRTLEEWQFTYNADGLRTKRTNGSRTYNYTYLGSQLTHMTVAGHTLYFSYDAAGTPLTLTYDGVTYYYVTNLQGDVVAILNSSGVEVVTYAYDAWGNLISPDVAEGTLGFYNPLRYRGYVYDEETGLYYLQSRYYNPEMGRFINADDYPSTGQGLIGNNMFAYCGNNPVARKDDGGEFWHIVAGAAIGAAVSFASSVIGDLMAGEEVDWAGAGISAAFGAVGGALAATGLGPVVQIAGGAVLAGAENAINQGRDNGFDKIDYNEVAVNAVIGGISCRSNGVSKSTAKHLHKQAAIATKRISNSFKHNTLKGISKTFKAAGKYYLSQTKTLFYKPLINSAWDDLFSSVKKSVFEIPTQLAG